MHSLLKKALCALLLVSFATRPAEARDRGIERAGEIETSGSRQALVIGNDAYRRSPLVNAVNDARAMDQTLRGMGFAVEAIIDADYPTFDRAIDLFADRLSPGDVALFYYAGHGVQIDGENYLIPIDLERANATKIKYRALPADLIRERMENSGARLSILILDACRDNPFHGSRSAGSGLAQMATGIGTFIAFSTAPGRTAADDFVPPAASAAASNRRKATASNGLFTHHLIRTLETPSLSIDEVFNEVRRKVHRDSDGRQVPWTASSLIGSFYFRPDTEPPRVAVSRRQATGSLEVTVDQGDAEIYLDGDHVATSTGAETIRIDEIAIGDYVVRVSKPAYLDVVRNLRVGPGATARMHAWLEIESFEPPPRQGPSPATMASFADDEFCQTLEQVLMACPGQFRDIVTPSRSRIRTFLEPTVCFPGAWYNKVYRAAPDSFEFLSSFEADLGASPAGHLDALVSRVEECLPAGTITWHQRRAAKHQLRVALTPGECQLEVAVSGENVDLEIYRLAR